MQHQNYPFPQKLTHLKLYCMITCQFFLLSTLGDPKSCYHWGSLQCVSCCVSLNNLPKQKKIHTECRQTAPLLYGRACVFSVVQTEKKPCRTGCRKMASGDLTERKLCHTGCRQTTFLQCRQKASPHNG